MAENFVGISDVNDHQLVVTSTGMLQAATSTPASPITYTSAAQAVSNTGVSFSMATATMMAIDITLTSFTGGTAPAVTFFADRLGNDGVWYRMWTSSALSSPTALSVDIGPTLVAQANNFGMIPTGTCRFGWSSTGSPTAITFSASVVTR